MHNLNGSARQHPSFVNKGVRLIGFVTCCCSTPCHVIHILQIANNCIDISTITIYNYGTY